jgi:hypothetical protein
MIQHRIIHYGANKINQKKLKLKSSYKWQWMNGLAFEKFEGAHKIKLLAVHWDLSTCSS